MKDIVRKVSSNYTYFYDASLLPAGGNTLNNSFLYNQNVAAGYVTYTMGLPKGFAFKPGVRFEYTSIDASFSNRQGVLTGTNIPDYGVLVPSINLSRKLDNGNVLKLAYNRRIQRPSLQFLNPNVQASNPYNVSVGNPLLRPEYTNNYELGYSTTIKQKVNTNFSLFMRNTKGSIQTVRSPLPDSLNPGRVVGGILSTYLNAGTEDAYGGSLFLGVNSGKLSLNGSTDVYYAVLRNSGSTDVYSAVYNSSNQGFVVNARAFGSYDLGKSYSLQLFGFYRGKQVQLQGYQTGFGIYSLSLQKSFAEKRGSVGIGAENFFTVNGIRIRTDVSTPYVDFNGVAINGPVLNQQSTNVTRNLNFKINFSYRIGKLTAGDAPRRAKGVNNDDLKEGGDAGGGLGGGAEQGGGQGGGAGAGGGRPGGRPAGAAGGYPGGGQRPGGARPASATDSTRRTIPADSLQRLRNQATSPDSAAGRPATTMPGTVAPATTTPGVAAPATPGESNNTTTTPTPSPAVKPTNTTSPVGPPSPGTTSPGGITPAGSPGGRP